MPRIVPLSAALFVTLALAPSPPVRAGNITLSQTTTQNIAPGNSIACTSFEDLHLDNSYLRRFDLASFGIKNDFAVTEVQVGVEVASGPTPPQPVTVRLYTWDPLLPFVFANFDLIGSANNVAVGNQTLSILSVPVSGTAPAGSTLVVELFTPERTLEGDNFRIGSNSSGQTAPGYLYAPDCAIGQPTDLADLGYPFMHMVMNVTGHDFPLVQCDEPVNGIFCDGFNSGNTAAWN